MDHSIISWGCRKCMLNCLFVWLMMFNATFNNISVISWRSVFIGGGIWRTRRRPPACHWQTSVVTGTDCIGCCKSNNHTITTTVCLTVFFSLSTNNFPALEKRLRCEMSTPYPGDVRILLLIKGKLTIGKVKSSRLSRCFQSSSVLDLNTKVKVRSRSLSVSSILWFKVIWIDVLQIIAESVTVHHLYNRIWN